MSLSSNSLLFAKMYVYKLPALSVFFDCIDGNKQES
jgi:hypothetical protein